MRPMIAAWVVPLAVVCGACGILDDGNRRYACLTNDDCMEGHDCSGAVKEPALDDGGCATAQADGGSSIVIAYNHDSRACYYLYCLPTGSAECANRKCNAGRQCGIRTDEKLYCVEEDAVRQAVRADATCGGFSDDECGTGTDKVCVLSLQLAVENYPQSQTDYNLVKKCVPRDAVE